MNKVTGAIISLVLITACTCAAAQSCHTDIVASAPAQRYHDHGDGSVTDTRSGLRWARCSLGQHWQAGHCEGEPRRLPWAIATLMAEDGWRLPELAELSSLTEVACRDPAINATLFPDTQAAPYWTATRFINADGDFWQVHFLDGESLPDRADTQAYVRLVRDASPAPAE
jgi:hypothetical protein